MLILIHYLLSVAEFVHKLIGDSQRQLHDVFTRTYGVLYERNSALFADYFRRIRSFYSRGATATGAGGGGGGRAGSLQEATLKFFTELYRKMFQVSSVRSMAVWTDDLGGLDRYRADVRIATEIGQ